MKFRQCRRIGTLPLFSGVSFRNDVHLFALSEQEHRNFGNVACPSVPPVYGLRHYSYLPTFHQKYLLRKVDSMAVGGSNFWARSLRFERTNTQLLLPVFGVGDDVIT